MMKHRILRLRGTLTCAATAFLMGLSLGTASAAEGAFAAFPVVQQFLAAPKADGAGTPAVSGFQVAAPPVEQVSVSVTANSIQSLAPDPALGVSNANVFVISLPRVFFSKPVPIRGSKEGQQDFFFISESADSVCQAFGFGKHADLGLASYQAVKRGQFLMGIAKGQLYQVETLFDRDYSYIVTLVCTASAPPAGN